LFYKLSKLKDTYKSFSGFVKGFTLTCKHLFRRSKTVRSVIQADNYFDERNDNTSTLRYPHVKLPLPDNSRNQLHVEIDDCIVCDLCAKICPVDCIDIIAIKAVEDIGKTSDGTTKRLHAAKFDIDMGKCMFCGLCTVVCPTECIIMTDEYDVSLNSVEALNYHFSTMTDEEAVQNRIKLASFEEEKKRAKEAALKAAQEKKEDGNV
jgi:NADH-quinone oxidoreductase subunit I